MKRDTRIQGFVDFLNLRFKKKPDKIVRIEIDLGREYIWNLDGVLKCTFSFFDDNSYGIEWVMDENKFELLISRLKTMSFLVKRIQPSYADEYFHRHKFVVNYEPCPLEYEPDEKSTKRYEKLMAMQERVKKQYRHFLSAVLVTGQYYKYPAFSTDFIRNERQKDLHVQFISNYLTGINCIPKLAPSIQKYTFNQKMSSVLGYHHAIERIKLIRHLYINNYSMQQLLRVFPKYYGISVDAIDKMTEENSIKGWKLKASDFAINHAAQNHGILPAYVKKLVSTFKFRELCRETAKKTTFDFYNPLDHKTLEQKQKIADDFIKSRYFK